MKRQIIFQLNYDQIYFYILLGQRSNVFAQLQQLLSTIKMSHLQFICSHRHFLSQRLKKDIQAARGLFVNFLVEQGCASGKPCNYPISEKLHNLLKRCVTWSIWPIKPTAVHLPGKRLIGFGSTGNRSTGVRGKGKCKKCSNCNWICNFC